MQMQSHAESGHEQERKIALSVSLEKNRRNVVNFDAARTANGACGYIMIQHRSSMILHSFASMHDGKLHYESGIFKKSLCSIFKIFTIEPCYGNS